MKKLFVLFIILCLFMTTQPSFAKMQKTGQAGMTFLRVGGSARASGMADVFTFAKGDLASVFYNPAGLATVDGAAFFFNNTSWIADMNLSHMAVSYDADTWGVFALSFSSIDYGDINGTAISTTDARGYTDISVGDVGGMAIGLSYGIQMTDKFSIGGTAKFINQALGQNDTYVADLLETPGKENKIDCFGFDFGTMYDTGIRSLVLSMSIQNYSGQQLYENEEFQLPQTYRIGISGNLFELLPLGVENQQLTVALEGVDQPDREEFLATGMEYNLLNMIDLRAGYNFQRRQDNVGGLNAGVGFKLESFNLPFNGRFDISYSDFGSVFDDVIRFSIQGSF